MSKEERSWIFYDWACSAYTMTVLTVILPIFFKSYAANGIESNLSTAYWGYANSIATLFIALCAPILGTIADYKGYKKKFFNIFFALGVASTILLIIPKEGNWFLCLVFFIISSIGYSGSNIFYDSFLVDVTAKDKMDWISSSGFAYGYIGSTIPFIISMFFVLKPSLFGMDTIGASKLAFIITAIWWFIFTIPMIKNVHQIHYIEPEKNPIQQSFKRLFSTLKDISSNKKIFMFLIAYFFYIDGVSTIIKMSVSYGVDVGISSNTLIVILLVTQFVAFPFALLFGKLAKKFSAKKMIFLGIIIYTLVTVYAFFLQTAIQFWIMAMVVATAQGGIQALSRSYFGKIIPKERSSEFFGFYNVFGRFAAILGPLLVAIVTQMTGQSRYGVLSLLLLFIIGGILFIRVEDENSNNKIHA